VAGCGSRRQEKKEKKKGISILLLRRERRESDALQMDVGKTGRGIKALGGGRGESDQRRRYWGD